MAFGDKLAQNPASAGQVHELARQVAALSEAVGRLAAGRENSADPEGDSEIVSRPDPGAGSGGRSGEKGTGPGAPGADFSELTTLLQEQKSRPFGLDLRFVQATLMAVFSLARGSFFNYPGEWEPFKAKSKRRRSSLGGFEGYAASRHSSVHWRLASSIFTNRETTLFPSFRAASVLR